MVRIIQRSALLIVAGLVAAVGSVCAQTQSEQVGSSPAASFDAPERSAPLWNRGSMGNILFDNGPLVNSAGTGAAGADESVLQDSSLSMIDLGYGHQIVNNNRLADDFTIPAGQSWLIDEIVLFAYQTGSTTTSTFNDLRVRIWDGVPQAPGSNIVFGDLTTNVLAGTAFSGIYRVTEASSGATNRPIMANRATINTVLGAGTYYIDWMAGGTLASGPWAPPITITGQTATGDALQSLNGADYLALVDQGPQGLPFIVAGTIQADALEARPVPTLGTPGLIAMLLLLSLVAATVLHRRA